MQRISQKFESIGVLHVYESWKLIRPLALRKDFWSKAILWENGGILVDGKFTFEAPSTEWIDWENDEMIQFADTYPSGTLTGIEAYTQYHPLLVEEIMEIVFRVRNRAFLFESYWNSGIKGSLGSLDLTGPGLAGEVIDRSKMTPKLTHARFMLVLVPVANSLYQMQIRENSLPVEA
jgi:hypothetical protein